MPDWLQATYFDPESQRNHPLIHDYQQHDILDMRSMENCKLVDCVELPLNPYDHLKSAFQVLLDNGLYLYMSRFVVPLIGHVSSISAKLSFMRICTIISPLYISLHAGENVLLNFHPLFSELYAFLFWGNRKLGKKLKPWQIYLLL